jgi:hypothetical protein
MTQDQAERYRQAAEDALEQLDWCIGYFHGARKGSISARLAQNRSYIRQNLMHQPAEPVPSEATSES